MLICPTILTNNSYEQNFYYQLLVTFNFHPHWIYRLPLDIKPKYYQETFSYIYKVR
jgi:hypothetical protein